MKSVVAVLSVLLFTSLALAQDKPPAPAGSPQDTMLQEKNAPDRETGPMSLCPHQKRLFPGHGMNFRPDMMGPGPGFAEMEKGNRHPSGPCFMHHPPRCCFFMPVICKLLFLGLMLYAVLNILLTIIVSLDMARNNRFNGLWIPVLLLAGIPGSAIYALFRIGDKIQCKGTV